MAIIPVFIIIWIIGFGSSIFASRCLKSDLSVESKLSACNWASKTTISKYIRSDHPEYAAIELERIVSLAQLGNRSESLLAMKKLLSWASIDTDRRGPTGDYRNDRVASVIFTRVSRFPEESPELNIFSLALGFEE